MGEKEISGGLVLILILMTCIGEEVITFQTEHEVLCFIYS